LSAAAFLDNYKKMKGNGNIDEYSNEYLILRIHPKTGKKILFVNTKYVKKIIDMDKEDSDEILNKVFTH
jgi:alpha-ketoglutarate-dependent taurine dioxygenase